LIAAISIPGTPKPGEKSPADSTEGVDCYPDSHYFFRLLA
jgi:hypothetical protein